MADVLLVKEEDVRRLSVARLRLLIYLLQGHVVPKPGNVKYVDRAIRLLTAWNTPFFEAQWEAVHGLAPNARHDPVMFRQLKEAADEAIRVGNPPRRAQFVPTPSPAASANGSVDGEEDWQSVEGPPSDLQGRAAPPSSGIPLADNAYGRLAVYETGMEINSDPPVDLSRARMEGSILTVPTADRGPKPGPAKRCKRSHGDSPAPAPIPAPMDTHAQGSPSSDAGPFSVGQWTRRAPRRAQRQAAPKRIPASYAEAARGAGPASPTAPIHSLLGRFSAFLRRITEAPPTATTGASTAARLLHDLATDAPLLLAEAHAVGAGLSAAEALASPTVRPRTTSPSFPPHVKPPMSDRASPTQDAPTPAQPARPTVPWPAQAPWTGARTLLLRPLDNDLRRRPIGARKLAAMSNMALQRRAPPRRRPLRHPCGARQENSPGGPARRSRPGGLASGQGTQAPGSGGAGEMGSGGVGRPSQPPEDQPGGPGRSRRLDTSGIRGRIPRL